MRRSRCSPAVSFAVLQNAAICRLFLVLILIDNNIRFAQFGALEDRRGRARSDEERRMIGYRLYYLDKHSHIAGRDEFFASDDKAALIIAASLHEASECRHSGLMLWQGTRQVFATDESSDCLVFFSFPDGARA